MSSYIFVSKIIDIFFKNCAVLDKVSCKFTGTKEK